MYCSGRNSPSQSPLLHRHRKERTCPSSRLQDAPVEANSACRPQDKRSKVLTTAIHPPQGDTICPNLERS